MKPSNQSRFGITTIFRRHFQTFYNYGLYEWSGKREVPNSDYATFLLLPFLISVILSWLDTNFINDFSELIITCLSIFIGLLFNLLVLVFDLAKKEKEKLNGREPDHVEKATFTLTKELFVNIAYSIALSIICVISIFIAKFHPKFLIDLLQRTKYFDCIRSCYHFTINLIVIFLMLQFLLTLLMILKRFFIIFNKQVESVSQLNDETNSSR